MFSRSPRVLTSHVGSQVSQAIRGMHAFQVPPSWAATFSAAPSLSADEAVGLPKPHVFLVKGQKNSGKSTFARMLVNRLSFRYVSDTHCSCHTYQLVSRYRRVAFLECDLGQSEFTPGGMVALNIIERPVFGPPFTHPTIPHQAHYNGAHNPRSSPSHYLRAIQTLVEGYRLDLQFATSFVDIEDDEEDDRIVDLIPLVVNTMGWTKGLGADLSRRIEEFVQPSDIFSFETSPSNGAVEPEGPLVHTLDPITPPQRFTPSDHRALSLLSYFHAVFPDPIQPAPLEQTATSRWNTDLPLCAHPPYEITSSLALDRIVLTGAGAEDVVRTELGRVLAGALVALVSAQPPPEGIEELYTPGFPPPDPASSNCLGLALVRGVSNDGSKIQLLTPVPPEGLVNARILVMGELQLPVWGWLDFRSAEGGADSAVDVPFLRWGRSAGAGSERRRVRRNIMRRAQM
jgi:polynucleotide 5'-hydroxyl-kinase GRC3/NOL9